MNHAKTFLLICLIFLSGCASYNDVKLNIFDAQTKEPLGDTYVLVDDMRGMIPTPFRQQKLYKTDSKGELIIDRDGSFKIKAIRAGYLPSIKWADTYKNSDPTKDGFVPKAIFMGKSDEKYGVSLEPYILSDCDSLTKEFIDFCFANKIKIYRGNTGFIYNRNDDK